MLQVQFNESRVRSKVESLGALGGLAKMRANGAVALEQGSAKYL